MTEYILRVTRLTASKLRFQVNLNGSLLYVFFEEDPLNALQKILKFCYFRDVSLRTMSFDEFLRLKTSEQISYVALFSRVERERVQSFYI